MLKLFEQEHPKLVHRILRIDQRQGDALKRQVPGGEPRILPFVRERHDPQRIQMLPMPVADASARVGRRPVGIVAIEPAADVEDVALLVPEHARESLPLDEPFVVGCAGRVNRLVKLIGLLPPLRDDRVDVGQRIVVEFVRFRSSVPPECSRIPLPEPRARCCPTAAGESLPIRPAGSKRIHSGSPLWCPRAGFMQVLRR